MHADDPWNTFYAGAHAGYAWGSVDVTDTTGGVAPGPFSYSPKGAFAGGTAGLNWRLQGILLGVEGDLGYMDLSGSGTAPSSTPPPYAQPVNALDVGLVRYSGLVVVWAAVPSK